MRRTRSAGPTSPLPAQAGSPAYFLADHAALDFLNTVAGTGRERREFLSGDREVLDWLERAGLPTDHALLKRAPRGRLQEAAVALREEARALIERRKAGKHGNPDALNRVLGRGAAYRQLVWKPGSHPRRVTHGRIETPEDLLLPVAESIAELLEAGDFKLVRRCENPACTLWFYDRTKSHQRRWCSMAICGNRMKVAAFRARQRARR